MSSSSPSQKRKWKNILLAPSFQFRFGFKMAIAAIIAGSANILLFYHYMHENYEIFIDSLLEAGMLSSQVVSLLYQEFYYVFKIMILITLGFAIFCIILGVISSHRIIGPSVAFHRVFQQIREGNREARIKLRPKDEFQDIAEDFNKMMDQINDQ